jgi:hypothetical protein
MFSAVKEKGQVIGQLGSVILEVMGCHKQRCEPVGTETGGLSALHNDG